MPGPSLAVPTMVALPQGPASIVDEGHGPPLVLVHGAPGSARDFRWLTPHLTASFRVVRVELPGFGGTPRATGADPSALGRGRFLLALCDALGLERPVILGHSLGGVAAQAAAWLRPTGVHGLALVASAGLRPHAVVRRSPIRGLLTALRHPATRWAARPVVRGVFGRIGFPGASTAAIERTLEVVDGTDFAEHAARVRDRRVPTLVAWCDDDPLIERAIAEELALASAPGPRLRWASGGHNPQKSRAAELAAALVDWHASLGDA